MGKEKKNLSISPKEYKLKLDHFELQLINLESCSAKINRDRLGKTLKNIIKDTIDYKLAEENSVVFKHSYTLISTPKTQRDFAIKIECTFNAKFSSDIPLDEDFLEIFSNVNIHVNTWPYFREFLQSTILRMGLPPLTLPFFRQFAGSKK